MVEDFLRIVCIFPKGFLGLLITIGFHVGNIKTLMNTQNPNIGTYFPVYFQSLIYCSTQFLKIDEFDKLSKFN